jgi:hypothetical protein
MSGIFMSGILHCSDNIYSADAIYVEFYHIKHYSAKDHYAVCHSAHVFKIVLVVD